VDSLARKVAKRTGETLTEAVTRALEERLDRIESTDRKREEQEMAELMAISDRSAKLLRGLKKSSTELVDELYDEYGLPR
jgi:antitoxin VapB